MDAQRQQVAVPELLADILDQTHLRHLGGVVGHLRREAAHQAGALGPDGEKNPGTVFLAQQQRQEELADAEEADRVGQERLLGLMRIIVKNVRRERGRRRGH